MIISKHVSISSNEIEITAIRAQGAGGQNVNKLSSAIHLRFDIHNSSLPDIYKQRLLDLADYRITKGGIIIIKAQRYRTQDKNKEDALLRLQQLLQKVTVIKKRRKATKPTIASQRRRIESKVKRSNLKKERSNTSKGFEY